MIVGGCLFGKMRIVGECKRQAKNERESEP